MMVPARQRPKLLVMPAFHPGVQHCGADGYLIPHGGDDRVGVVQIRVGGGVDHDPLPCCAFYHAAAGGVFRLGLPAADCAKPAANFGTAKPQS